MIKKIERNNLIKHIQGFASHILEEVIKADSSMHEAQVNAWTFFGKYRPRGDMINEDIHLGFAEKRYLALNEVKLIFYVKPLQFLFFKRLRLAFHTLFTSSSLPAFLKGDYDLCSSMDEKAVSIEIIISREKNKLTANYAIKDKIDSEVSSQINT